MFINKREVLDRMHILDLPDKVILKIMGYLSLCDIHLSAYHVCKKFLELSQKVVFQHLELHLTEDGNVNFDTVSLWLTNRAAKAVSIRVDKGNCDLKAFNVLNWINFNSLTISGYCAGILKTLSLYSCDKIKILDLIHCPVFEDLSSQILTCFLLKCSNLEKVSLNIIDTDLLHSLLLRNQGKLKSLRLVGWRLCYEKKEKPNWRLLYQCPNLSHLQLRYSNSLWTVIHSMPSLTFIGLKFTNVNNFRYMDITEIWTSTSIKTLYYSSKHLP